MDAFFVVPLSSLAIGDRIRRWSRRVGRLTLGIVMMATASGAPSTTPLHVGIEDYAPFSFLDESGQPTGFAVDLLKAIAAEEQLNLQFELKSWSAVMDEFNVGRIDILANVTYSLQRTAFIDYSITHSSLPAGVLVRKGGPDIQTFEDLRDKSIAVAKNTTTYDYLVERGWAPNLLLVDTLSDAIIAVNEGKCDAVVTSRLVAAKFIRDNRLRNIEAINIIVPDLRFRSHFGVRRGDTGLLYHLNEGLATVRSNGTYDRLHEKWFGPLESRKIRFKDLLPYLGPIGAILLAVLVALVWQRHLLAKSYERLRASTYLYHSLVESLPQIIVRKDTDGRYTYVNSAFAELVGRPIEEIVGRSDREISPPGFAPSPRVAEVPSAASHQVVEYENVVGKLDGTKRRFHVKETPLFDAQNLPLGVQVIYWDITAFRETEEQLRRTQRDLVEASHLAGMAEVATNILHNIGNTLNSVNVSATLAVDRMRQLKIANLAKMARMLDEQGDQVAEFFTTDPRGKKVPSYLAQLAEQLQFERDGALHEIENLCLGVEHIKEIVAAQQSYSHAAGLTEVVAATELVEFALNISEASLVRAGIVVVREFLPTPPVQVQRHKALQILGNLIRNATESMEEAGRADKRLTVGIHLSANGNVQIEVIDNGVGIAPENLTRIFAHGFTTKKTGHGFGLHGSALAATEMNGSLVVKSDGPGKGATFVLELPPVAGVLSPA